MLQPCTRMGLILVGRPAATKLPLLILKEQR